MTEVAPPLGTSAPPCAIRPVATIAEYDACEEIQRKAWGYQDIDVVPTNELLSVAKAGGLVLGAFAQAAAAAQGEPQERLIGFCFGLLGRDHATGRLYHFSRMVGVDPEARGRGIAQRLKHAQRDAVLAQGLDLMRWTFDPLQSLNASLNVARLGAEAVTYVRDMYGGATTSPLHALGTDRVIVEWRLRGPRLAPDPRLPALPIPQDLAALKRTDLPRAQRERLRVRAAFEAALAEGQVAVDFDPARGYLFAHARDHAQASAPSQETPPS